MYKKYFYLIAIVVVIFLFTRVVFAQDIISLQSQIQALLVQINQLQNQINQSQGVASNQWCHTFNVNLGLNDKSNEVTALQKALTEEGFSSGNDVGNQIYGNLTALAVNKFQEKYKSDILDIYGLKYPTGFVGKTTRAKLNSLYGCISSVSTSSSSSSTNLVHTTSEATTSTISIPENATVGEPHISSLSSINGPIGTHVVIIGSNFDSVNTLNFGEKIKLNAYSSDGTNIDFYVPSGLSKFYSILSNPTTDCSSLPMSNLVTAGNYQISITNNSGTSNDITFGVVPKTVVQIQNDLLSGLIANKSQGDPVNISKDVIACIQTSAQFETMVDSYFSANTFNNQNWLNSSQIGWDQNSWGRNWLSERSAYLLGIEGWKMSSQLSSNIQQKMKLVLRDAADGNHIVYDKCGSEQGNSCSEDYIGIVMAVSAAKLNGITGLDGVEQNYIQKTFNISSDPNDVASGLVSESKSWDGGATYTKMYNHGEENPVYAGILFVDLNDAAYAYSLAQGASLKPSLPSYYTQPSMIPLFQWIQTKSSADGSSYLNTCHQVNNPNTISCGDPGTSAAIPGRIPGGRFVRAFLGNSAFLPNLYSFENFSGSQSGNYDMGRELEYSTYNPMWIIPTLPPTSSAPSCSISFSPTSIVGGGLTNAKWYQTGDADGSIPYSCTGDIGSGTLSGNEGIISNIISSQTQTCTLDVSNSVGNSSCGAKITVTAPTVSAPTAQLWAEYPDGTKTSQVPLGAAPFLHWNSANATECHSLAGAGFSTGGFTQGNDQVNAMAGTTTFSILCTGTGGSVQANATVGVSAIIAAPTCSLSFSPARITRGGSSTATWTSTGDADDTLQYSCTGDIGNGVLTPANNKTSVSPTQSQTCTLTAINSAGTSATCSAGITVDAPATPAPTATLTADPTSMAQGGVPVLTWSSTNAGNCSVLTGAGFHTNGLTAGDTSGAYASQGVTPPSPLAGTTTFSIRCYEFANKTGRTADASATVTVSSYVLNIDAALYPNTNCTGTAGPMGSAANSVSYNLSTPSGATTHGVGSLNASAGTYQITGAAVTPAGYKYCSASNAVTFNSAQSQTLTVTGYFAPLPAPTLTISPTSTSACVGDTANYISWYDPDGPSGPAGNQNVTNNADWSSDNPSVASVSFGVATGKRIGTATIISVYSGIRATAVFTVNACVAGTPDYSIQINPGSQNVQKPGSTSYDVTVSSINNYAGTVSLSPSNFISGVSGSFAGGPSAVVPSGGSVVKTLNVFVASSAGIGISTFRVTGDDGSITHFTDANINVTDVGGGFSCTITPSPSTGPSPLSVNLSNTITGGSGNYGCRVYYESGSIDANYADCSTRNYTYRSPGTKSPVLYVLDRSGGGTTQCGANVNVTGGGGGGGAISCTLNVIPVSLRGQAGVTNFGFQAVDVTGGDGNYSYDFNYGDGHFSGSQHSNSSYYIYPSQGTYTASLDVADGSGNSGSCNIAPSVISISAPPPSGCIFTASPSAILYGQSSTLSWSCSPTNTPRNCTIKYDANNTVGTGLQAGTKSVKPAITTTYTLSCTGSPAVANSTASVSVGFLPVIKEIIPR